MTTPRLMLALASARRTDLASVNGASDDVAVADEVWEAALAAAAAGLAADEESDAIRHRLLAAWRHDTAGAPESETAFVGDTWTRALVVFDVAVALGS